MRWFVAVGLALAVGAACGGQAGSEAPAPAGVSAGTVYVTGGPDGGLRMIDSATGRVQGTLPASTPAPDWRWLYRVSAGTLTVLEPLTGQAVASHAAPGWAQAVRTSSDGRWLVFTGAGQDGRFRVQDAAFAAAPIDVALRGAFTFDGVSNDGRRLYLLEWVAAGRYQVRMYDLRRGALSADVITEKGESREPMSGEALAGFATRDGSMQLTLYQRNAGGQAFVHALPLVQDLPFAYCIDLPAPAEGWGFVPAPDGRRFYAVNPLAGQVVELAAQGPEQAPTTRQQRFELLAAARSPILEASAKEPGRPAAAAVAPDGATLYVALRRGVVAIDTRTLKVRSRALGDREVTALAAAPGGAVYAVGEFTRLLRLDPHSLAVASDVPVGGRLEAIVRAT